MEIFLWVVWWIVLVGMLWTLWVGIRKLLEAMKEPLQGYKEFQRLEELDE